MFFKKNRSKKKLTLDQMCYTNALCLEAIVNTLVKKQVCTKEEVLSEVRRLSETVGREEGNS